MVGERLRAMLRAECGRIEAERSPSASREEVVDGDRKRIIFRRTAVVSLVIITLLGALIVDSLGAAVYYYVNWMRLQKAADAAAIAGANYLPGNPAMAINTARTYVRLNGVSAGEIISAAISPDQQQITIKLMRRVPFYLSGAATGFHSRRIVVTGKAAIRKAVRGMAVRLRWFPNTMMVRPPMRFISAEMYSND
jgi:hypothetical protein